MNTSEAERELQQIEDRIAGLRKQRQEDVGRDLESARWDLEVAKRGLALARAKGPVIMEVDV